jgi:sporulation protein YlmC with PRC-barrel domain
VHKNRQQQIRNSQRQGGATFIGMLLVTGSLVLLALVTIKIFPAYQEYYSVQTAIHALNKEPLSSMSKKEIIDAFNKHADAEKVTVVTDSDLKINKNNSDETVVSAKYQVLTPLFANVSILIDFAIPSDGK